VATLAAAGTVQALESTGHGEQEARMHPYPQMPPFTEVERDAFLSAPGVARLSSLNPDGTIHTVPVMFRFDGRDIVIGTQLVTRKVRNIEHNPNVTVLVDNQVPPFQGVLVYGRAELDHEDVVAKRTEIFERYMPTERAVGLATGLANLYTPVIIRVRPERITSWDYTREGFIQSALRSIE
jgi:PPOX class probable F420-dependent enzyme